MRRRNHYRLSVTKQSRQWQGQSGHQWCGKYIASFTRQLHGTVESLASSSVETNDIRRGIDDHLRDSLVSVISSALVPNETSRIVSLAMPEASNTSELQC
jgi:hypothetical protein